jgi:hypothetical protein
MNGGALLPLGGSREHSGHKGYCLSAMVSRTDRTCSHNHSQPQPAPPSPPSSQPALPSSPSSPPPLLQVDILCSVLSGGRHCYKYSALPSIQRHLHLHWSPFISLMLLCVFPHRMLLCMPLIGTTPYSSFSTCFVVWYIGNWGPLVTRFAVQNDTEGVASTAADGTKKSRSGNGIGERWCSLVWP